ncbi:L-type lectin-domain containing receptor kinase IX.1-like [Vitis riparia]|uniref:L-type lectin-domain containing receptor kinase IX.1-like n=1 Tax=Vitis riparia TaxID=96939 RepID=UPI00155A85BA|nr:L-type lectin-domain containing receptor kinase IX.1-like [Vitis riparia]
MGRTLYSTMSACNTRMESHKLLSFHLFMISIFFVLIFFPSAISLSFNFSSFGSNNYNISSEGDAEYSSGCIQLTINQNDKQSNDSWGRAMYSERLYLWDQTSRNLTDFTSNFSFVINSQHKREHADGLTFFLNGTQLHTDALGENLGLANEKNETNKSAVTFIAVEFDTFTNAAKKDPEGEHIGIDINSMISVKTVNWSSNIKEGKLNHVSISYTSSSHNLSVVLITEVTDSTNTTQSLSYEVDLREYLPEYVTMGFSGATGTYFQINKICSWNFSSTLEPPSSVEPGEGKKTEPGEGKKTELAVGLSVSAFVVVGGFGLAWFYFWRKRNTGGDQEDGGDSDLAMDEDFEKGTGPRKFSFNELALATTNFSEGEKLGEGGFGGVYRGFLRELNSYVAVKRVTRNSQQGMKEYASEVKIFCRLRHRNLVQLMGWCHQKGELLLVYELLPNGSLSTCLFEEKTLLTWAMRYRIALGLASSLLYLHEEWEQCVVHRDIKSSNVMLDSDFNAKLGDFGLARLVDHGKGSQTTVLAGTMGYMAPECFMTGKASKESDVYSFGIVALEICCGRRAVEAKVEENQIRLVEWVWDLYGVGKLLEAADPRLSADYDEQQMERLMIVGLWCAHPDCNARPSMRQAISVLNSEALLPLLPIKMPVPMYYAPPALQTSYSTSVSERNHTQFSNSSNGTTDSSKFLESSPILSQSASVLHAR